MGWSIPAALGAQSVHPGRQTVTITGDGCFLMSATEISTAAREGLPVKFFVLDDQAYHYMQELQKPGLSADDGDDPGPARLPRAGAGLRRRLPGNPHAGRIGAAHSHGAGPHRPGADARGSRLPPPAGALDSRGTGPLYQRTDDGTEAAFFGADRIKVDGSVATERLKNTAARVAIGIAGCGLNQFLRNPVRVGGSVVSLGFSRRINAHVGAGAVQDRRSRNPRCPGGSS